MKYAYFPGCTAGSTSAEYEESVRETSSVLGIEFTDIPGWTCCGASSAHVISHELSLALPGRNIALAERMDLPVAAPCPACSLRFKNAEYELGNNPVMKQKIERDIGLPLRLAHPSKHILEILYHEVGIEKIRAVSVKPLKGLKVVPYYGCYLVRPPAVTRFDNPENPVIMDAVCEAAGAEVVDWSYKVDCCGGSLSIPSPDIVSKLSNKIVQGAREAQADAIVCACGICQLNLDMRQPVRSENPPVPVLYFSELLSLAFGSTSILTWARRHFVDPLPVLERRGLL
jgi:heterodisulfide reductase subunit B